jgi:UDP-GlcNAc3NAcA epimerase
MKKILTVIGARPQFIKASVVSHAIAQTPCLCEVVVHTGQHYDTNMSAVFFTELGMRAPDYNLGICGGGHGAMTGRMLAELERVMLDELPEVVLVYGDTNSTLAGALAAAKLHIPVAHVEAGLRSFNMKMPEEINRILTDRISRWLFTPTEAAAQHLYREGVAKEDIFPVGDVMYDVALHHSARVQPKGGILAKLGLSPKDYILTTVHRAENTEDSLRMTAIVEAMQKVANSIPVVWPLHPHTRCVLEKSGQIKSLSASMHVIEPVGYLDMVQLEKYAALIATDSGGVQKEAFFYQVPCVTLRDETEWDELVEAGWNRLAPPVNVGSIVKSVHSALGSVGKDLKLYGNGDGAVRIVSALLDKQ